MSQGLVGLQALQGSLPELRVFLPQAASGAAPTGRE